MSTLPFLRRETQKVGDSQAVVVVDLSLMDGDTTALSFSCQALSIQTLLDLKSRRDCLEVMMMSPLQTLDIQSQARVSLGTTKSNSDPESRT